MKESTAARQGARVKKSELVSPYDRMIASQERTAAQIDKLERAVKRIRRDLGDVTQYMRYDLQNEAYRMLPPLLANEYGIHLSERLIRTEIDGMEIDFFARGEREGQAVCVIGKADQRMHERDEARLEMIFDQLDRQAKAVQQQYPDCEIVQLVVTHFAQPEMLQRVREHGLLVVQSFEW